MLLSFSIMTFEAFLLSYRFQGSGLAEYQLRKYLSITVAEKDMPFECLQVIAENMV